MLINNDTMNELRDLLGDGFNDLIAVFMHDAAKHVATLEGLAAAAAQPGEYERPAHALKGSSANIGAEALARVATELVLQSRAGKVPDPAHSIARIRACLDQTLPLLKGQCG